MVFETPQQARNAQAEMISELWDAIEALQADVAALRAQLAQAAGKPAA
jgi:uncharacterized protein YceH (UPF0502 family)